VIFDHADGHPLIEGLNGSPLPAPQAFTVLNQVAGALAYAHLQGVPHLRLSPQVILTDGDDVVRVTGFGEGLLLEGSSRSADRRQTQDYLAPEQLAGAAGDAASDIYALGTVAYRLFTGRTPGTSTYDRPSELNPQVDEAVDVLVGRARAIDPARRFQDVGQMRQEMQRIARADRPGGFSQTVRWVLGLASQGMHWLTETRFRRLALTTLVLLALSAELWLAWPPGRGLTRSLVLLALICIPASLLCDWRVRDIARQMGYGSLIHSGRGMGVVLGALATVWLVVKLTVYGQPIFVGEPAPADFWSAYLVAPILTFAMTYLMLTTAHALGQLAERRSGRYAIGFYAGFLSWCVLVVLLIVLPIPSPLTLAS
jgi:hypothetical protein